MGERDRHQEAELIRRARGGDEDAFATLVEGHRARLEGRVRRLLAPPVRRKVSVADVMQQAHLVVLRRIGGFEDRGDGSFGRWLGRIVELEAKTIARRYLGTDKRDVGREVSRDGRADTAQFRGNAGSPSQLAIANELWEAVPKALGELSSDHRRILRLVQDEGVSFEGAAERMDRTLAATRKLYGRALARLAELLNVRDGGTP